ncbi:Uncharacterized conserved protein [Phaffia rhodozyma]|uniref:U3 small nucleolar RNA-associated protein 10 n=1 Tax=Phaffia rhodozyma TaxID=264483 RepID=A0A0F7SYG8_PHARH|nr:Uncharacterized conserved protein [Phaffia rhodozyma]
MSSLASQLASIASLDASRLGSLSKQVSNQASYLFSRTEAAQHDFETIHSLGVNGFEELKELDPSLVEFEEDLFGEAAKVTDRMVLSKEENVALGATLDIFLSKLAKHLPLRAAAKVIEWLVRRFRVHEMNFNSVLSAFLPYHDSTQFVRILSILKVPKNSHFSFLIGPQTAHVPLSRHHLILSLHQDKSRDLLRFVSSILTQAIQNKTLYRTLVNFHASILVGFLAHGGQSKLVGDTELTIIIPEVVNGLKASLDVDCISSNLIVLLATARKATLSPEAIHVFLMSVLNANDAFLRSEKGIQQAIASIIGVLQSQEELRGIEKDAAERLGGLPNAGNILAHHASQFETSRALRPIIVSLIQSLDLPSSMTTLQAFATCARNSIPLHLISFLIRGLLLSDAGSEVSEVENARVNLLAILKERYAETWETDTVEILDQIPEVKKNYVLDLCAQVAQTKTLHGHGGDMFINLNSADSANRLNGVQSLIGRLAKELKNASTGSDMDVDVVDVDELGSSARENLLPRLCDTYLPVLEAIYSSPSVLFSAVPEPEVILSTICAALDLDSLSKAIVRRHIQFLVGPFASKYPELGNEVIRRVLFRYLLISKTQQVVSGYAWEALASSDLGNIGVLSGIAQNVQGSEIEGENKHEKQAELNTLIVQKIAANVIQSEDQDAHIKFMLSKLADSDPHSRVLSHLILSVILKLLKGTSATSAAILTLEKLRGIRDGFACLEPIQDSSLDFVVLKPSAAKTTLRVRGILIGSIQEVKFTHIASICWLDAASWDAEAVQVARFAYLIYGLVNSSKLPLSLSARFLRHLFAGLRDNTLLFLASIWTATPGGVTEFSSALQTAALRHAEAFLQAHVQSSGSETMDFQTVIPALIVALGSLEKPTREAALKCVELIRNAAGNESTVPFALNDIYGSRSERVQILKPSDLRAYLDIILNDQGSLSIDPAHIVSVHTNYLTLVKGEPKKDAGFKRGLLSYILSHVASWQLVSAQAFLLRTVQAIRDSVRIQILHPLLADLNDAPEDSDASSLVALLMDSYDRSAVTLFPNHPEYWNTFKNFIKSSKQVASSALFQLQHSLYRVLPVGKQIEIFETLVRQVADPDTTNTGDIKLCLRDIAPEPEVIIATVFSLRPDAEVFRSTKRNKTDSENQLKALNVFHRGLIITLEARSVDTLPGSVELLVALLEVLASLMDIQTKSEINIDYAEQLLLTGLCAVSSKIDTVPRTQEIDQTVLMRVISDSKNPQTFQQGLVLVSNFARFSPAVVLQNALPIFISVGAHTLQRDDDHTFLVVEKTIESILPVMVDQFKSQTSNRSALWNQCLEVLQVFSGMANHVPAHRKTRLFSTLIKVLGPSDFLGAVTMLLLDHVAFKSKIRTTEASTFTFPLAVFESFDVATRYEGLNDIVNEIKNLLRTPEEALLTQAAKPFTDVTDATKIERRRVLALLSFVHFASNSPSIIAVAGDVSLNPVVKATVGGLLEIQAIASRQIRENGNSDLVSTSQLALDSAVRNLSVLAFAEALTPLFESDDLHAQLGACAALTNRLPGMKTKARKDISPALITALASSLKIVESDEIESDLCQVLETIKAIASTATPLEDPSLAQAVGTLIARGKRSQNSANVQTKIFSVLAVINRRIGPRLIPYIKPIIVFSTEIIDQNLRAGVQKLEQFRDTLFPAILESLSALISSVPTFVGGQLRDLLATILRPSLLGDNTAVSGRFEPIQGLLNAIAKTVPAKSTLPAIFKFWEEVDKSSALPLAAILDLLRRVIRNANREVLTGLLKSLFSFFLSAFDSRWTLKNTLSSEEVHVVEVQVINAFLEVVVKLSEASFRPLFVRIYDWAVVELVGDEATGLKDEHVTARRTTLFSIMFHLLRKFKSIINPYMALILDHSMALLQSYAKKDITNVQLWKEVLAVFGESLECDEGTYWTDELLSKLTPILVSQLPVAYTFDSESAVAVYAKTMASLSAATTSPSLLKSLNHTLLLHSRSDIAEIRSLGLQIVKAVWEKSGDEMLEFVPHTVSDFVAELVEDEDEGVEASARGLLKVIEGLVGPLSGAYFGEEI